jgi:hypothetical protein
MLRGLLIVRRRLRGRNETSSLTALATHNGAKDIISNAQVGRLRGATVLRGTAHGALRSSTTTLKLPTKVRYLFLVSVKDEVSQDSPALTPFTTGRHTSA